MEITEVVERIIAGDRQAFAQIVTAYQSPLFRYLSRMGLPQAKAEELAQETFLRAWTRLGDFDSRRGAFSAWFFTIAHRLALNELTRASTTRELPPAEDFDPAGELLEPSEELLAMQRQRLLRKALLELPAQDRSSLALALIEGLPLATVAKIEGCRVGALKTRLHRARHKLAALLENDIE